MPQTLQQSEPATFADWLRECYRGSSWLTVTGYLMLLDTLFSLVGLIVDQTTVMGDPAWLKPLKFGISTSLFNFTVAFMISRFSPLSWLRRFSAFLGGVMSSALILEITLIDMQAARHTSSHFNVADPFDQGVFAIMGVGIAVVLLCTLILFVVSCFTCLKDRVLAWAIGLSVAMALIGMGTGILMVLPTPEQKAQFQAGGGLPRSGAHTVGAPDGGRELPLTGWSADHGDLRVAHFVGLHAMQLILLAWWVPARASSARWTSLRRLTLVLATAASIAAAYGILLSQALKGEPLLRPDAQTAASWVLLTVATGSLLLWALFQNPRTATLPSEVN